MLQEKEKGGKRQKEREPAPFCFSPEFQTRTKGQRKKKRQKKAGKKVGAKSAKIHQ
jgi:hypothetical protein